jgi:hypothetical protein
MLEKAKTTNRVPELESSMETKRGGKKERMAIEN